MENEKCGLIHPNGVKEKKLEMISVRWNNKAFKDILKWVSQLVNGSPMIVKVKNTKPPIVIKNK